MIYPSFDRYKKNNFFLSIVNNFSLFLRPPTPRTDHARSKTKVGRSRMNPEANPNRIPFTN